MTEAPLYIAAGFTGRRIDHSLAVLHAMLRNAHKRIVAIGSDDVMALVPPGRTLTVEVGSGARVSVFPLAPVAGLRSTGLNWPIDGLSMAAGTQIGTSNHAIAAEITVAFDRPGALLLLERRHLGALAAALRPEGRGQPA